MTNDEHFESRDVSAAPQALRDEAGRFPGGWVYEIDLRDVRQGEPIRLASIRGAWEAAEDGTLTGRFVANERYRLGRSGEVPIGYAVHLYPHDFGSIALEYQARSGVKLPWWRRWVYDPRLDADRWIVRILYWGAAACAAAWVIFLLKAALFPR